MNLKEHLNEVFTKLDLGSLYSRCKKSYYQCISNPDNANLEDQMEEDISKFILKDDLISIKVHKEFTEHFEISICIMLQNSDKKDRGEYRLILDPELNACDDYLIFYDKADPWYED